jgi:hypothetical protein
VKRALVIAIAIAALHGSTRADRLVLESYGGSRPAAADSVMARLRPLLDQRGFTTNVSTLAKRLADHAWAPATGSPTFDRDRFAQDVTSAINDYEEARFAQAAKALGDSVRSARANPISWVKEPKYRDTMMRCLLYDALALGRLAASASNDTERRDYDRQRDEIMGDLIRTYPSQVIGSRQYGREAAQLFDRVHKTLDDQGHGRLVVKVSDPEAVIYLDEVRQSQGSATIEKLTAGTHRALVDTKSGARQHLVTILPNQDTNLDVNWKLDSTLVVRDWIGLSFASDGDRAEEAAIAQRVAQLYTNVDYVAIVTISIEQSITVYGRLYEVATAKNVRGQQVELTGNGDDEQLKKFAAALMPPTQDQVAITAAPTLPSLPKRPTVVASTQDVRGPIVPILLATGGIATTAGAILYATGGGTNRGAATAGVAIGLGGLGLIGGGTYLWISRRSYRHPITAGMQPVRAGAVLTLMGPL